MSAIAHVHNPVASLFARAVLALAAKVTAGYWRLARAYRNRSDAAVRCPRSSVSARTWWMEPPS